VNAFHGVRADAALYGFVTTHEPGTHQSKSKITCSNPDCGSVLERIFKPNHSPQFMCKNVQNKGWRVNLKKPPLCPTCYRSSKAPAPAPAPKKEIEDMTLKASPSPIPVNARLTRLVNDKLNDVFNETTRRYTEGWSDERVANETETSLLFVESYRRGAFGELAEDPGLASLRNDVDALPALFMVELDKIKAQWTAQVDELRGKIAALPVQRR